MVHVSSSSGAMGVQDTESAKAPPKSGAPMTGKMSRNDEPGTRQRAGDGIEQVPWGTLGES